MPGTRYYAIAALAALLLPCWSYFAAAADPAPAANADQATVVIGLSNEVDDFMRDNLFRRFHQAEAAGAKTVILKIDTYGGLVTSGMDISRFLRGQTRIHTIAYVDNKAISAGAMIAMACNEIVMAPGGVLGDCAPIVVDPTGHLMPLPTAERAKMQSPIINDFRESAARNGYSPVLADAMVRVEACVYLVQDAQGHDRVADEAEYKTLTASGEWKPAPGVANPVDGPDSLLTVGADMAKRVGLSKATAASAQELAASRGFSIVADLSPTMGDHAVEFLNKGEARFVLLLVFFLALYITLHAPGHGAAEAVAIVSLGLLVGVPMLTGYAQWWELGLIFLGLGLCAFEILVFPGHGVSLALGIICIFLGLLMTFAGKDPGPGWLPSSHQSWHHLRIGLGVIVGAMVTATIGAFFLSPWLPKMPMFRRLILTETSSGTLPAAGAPLKAGEDVWPFVGTVGVTVTDLKPGGVVRFPYGSDTRNAPVVSVSGYTIAGTKVLVQEAKGNRIVVRVV